VKLTAQVELWAKALGQYCPEDALRILELEIFYGPNPFSPQPVVVCHMEIGESARRSADFVGMALAWLGDRLKTAQNSASTEGDAGLEQLADFAARLVSDLHASGLKIRLSSGATTQAPGRISFWTEFLARKPAVEAVAITLMVLGFALAGRSKPGELVARTLSNFDELCAKKRPNSASRVLIAGARAQNIPYLELCAYPSLWQFGWGERSERFWVSTSNGDGVAGGFISRSKVLQKNLFTSLGIPTPQGKVLKSGSNLTEAAKEIGFPCVVKPADGGGGKGVNAAISDLNELREAVKAAAKISPELLMEAHQPGKDYRLMVIDGKMVMTIRRSPPEVVGDGRSSVETLVTALNQERFANPGAYLKKVPLDDGLRIALASQGLDLASIPKKGQAVRLRTNANRATGGVCTDVTAETHEQIKRYAEQISRAFGLRVLGVDYITPDISKSHEEVGGAFLEVNATPGLEVLLTDGALPEKIGALVLGSKPGRIPIALVIADSEARDQIAARLGEGLAEGAGLVCAGWAQLGPLRFPETPLAVVNRAQSLLRFPTLKSLTVLWTPDELCTFGMPVDRVDTAVVIGSPLPDDWWQTLGRHAGKRVMAATIEDSLGILRP
jgi:cyanophycin synthetase